MRAKLLPVIHYDSDSQAYRNAQLAFDAGCRGVFLIQMDGDNGPLPAAARHIKAQWPSMLVGINYQGMSPAAAAQANIADGVDLTWVEAPLTHSAAAPWGMAQRVRELLLANPSHLVFSGVALGQQRVEPQPGQAALRACEFGFIPITSLHQATASADIRKVAALRQVLGEAPLAMSSDIEQDSVRQAVPQLSHLLVCASVSRTFFEFDFEKLCRLRLLCDRT